MTSCMCKNLSLPVFWKVIIGNSEVGGGGTLAQIFKGQYEAA